MTLMFAATYPGSCAGRDPRVVGGVVWRPASSDGRSMAAVGDASWRERFVAGWGTSESITVDLFAPSLAGDDEFRRWHQRYERNAASRDAIGVLIDLAA